MDFLVVWLSLSPTMPASIPEHEGKVLLGNLVPQFSWPPLCWIPPAPAVGTRSWSGTHGWRPLTWWLSQTWSNTVAMARLLPLKISPLMRQRNGWWTKCAKRRWTSSSSPLSLTHRNRSTTSAWSAAPVTQNHLSKPTLLILQNATPLRKSAPWPPNLSHEHVFCTAPATENVSLQIIFRCPMPAIVIRNATRPSCLAHFWQAAQSLAPARRNDIWASKSGPNP